MEFQVEGTMAMKKTVFWNVIPCSWAETHRRFGGKYCLRLRGLKSHANNQKPSCLVLASCLHGLFVDPEDEGIMFLRNTGEILPNYTASRSTYSLL
jgi:hypothetical protein